MAKEVSAKPLKLECYDVLGADSIDCALHTILLKLEGMVTSSGT